MSLHRITVTHAIACSDGTCFDEGGQRCAHLLTWLHGDHGTCELFGKQCPGNPYIREARRCQECLDAEREAANLGKAHP